MHGLLIHRISFEETEYAPKNSRVVDVLGLEMKFEGVQLSQVNFDPCPRSKGGIRAW